MLIKPDIENYFTAEKSESMFFIGIGLLAFILAIVFFFFLKTNWYRGAAVPLILFAVLHFTVGAVIYKRSDADRASNVYAYDMNPAALKIKELPRMQKVQKNFVVYRYAEIILLVLGIVLFLYYRNKAGLYFWAGLGMMLAIEAAVSLAADHFAEQRAKVYTEKLVSFTEKL